MTDARPRHLSLGLISTYTGSRLVKHKSSRCYCLLAILAGTAWIDVVVSWTAVTWPKVPQAFPRRVKQRRHISSLSKAAQGDVGIVQREDDSIVLSGVPNFAMQGKLRALGRFLYKAGPPLADDLAGGAFGLQNGGELLTEVAEALLDERWAEASILLRVRPNSAPPSWRELVASLRGLIVASSPGGQAEFRAGGALTSLAGALEAWEETASNPEKLDQEVEVALFEAIAALRAAARLLGAGPRALEYDATSDGENPPPPSASEIERVVVAARPDRRRTILRTLAIQFHPDRHPGREMEVLPTFLEIQRLREETFRWSN